MSNTLKQATETDLFQVRDLLYSRTDARAVIKSANAAFQRVSVYEWEELIGAPHKTVRHPGMPKGAFHLMWDYLKRGEPIGVYVINRTKTGQAYSVFAVVMPIDEELVSVRVKPISGRIDEIKALYDGLRAREEDEGLSPEQSADALIEAVRAMGYDGYDAFMSDSLKQEVIARCERLERYVPRDIEALSEIRTAVEQVAEEGQGLRDLLKNTDQIPYNLRLQASRLEGRDGPISVISANHQEMTENFKSSLQEFLRAAEGGAAPVRNAKFLTGANVLLGEVEAQIGSETGVADEKRASDLEAVARLKSYYGDKSSEAVRLVAERADYFDRVCKEMRRMVFGIEMTRTMCNIERTKCEGDTEALDGIVSRLQVAEKQLTEMMSQIDDAVHEIKTNAEVLLEDRRMDEDSLKVLSVA